MTNWGSKSKAHKQANKFAQYLKTCLNEVNVNSLCEEKSKYRLDARTNAIFLFPEIPFLGKLVQNIKIVSLSWNLVLILIRICRIHWSCSVFYVLTGNTLFGQIWSEKSKFEYTEFNGGVHFFCLDWKQPFWANVVQKIKIVSLSRNLVPKLIRICRIQWWYSLFLF